MIFDLPDIRNLAQETNASEIQFDEASRVVSFAKDGARINVHYKTGTVSTCLEDSPGGIPLFRQNVSPTFLKQIFEDPRMRRDRSRSPHRNPRRNVSVVNSVPGTVGRVVESITREERNGFNVGNIPIEESALKRVKCIKDEISVMRDILDGFNKENERTRNRTTEEQKQEKERRRKADEKERERKRNRTTEEQKQEKERRRKADEQDEIARCFQGKYARYHSSSKSDRHHVRNMFTELCTCVAIGDATIFMIYEDGRFFHTAGLQNYNLYKTLLTSSPPTYVALGSQKRYYAEFASGEVEWVGPDNSDMDKNLKESRKVGKSVRTVAFGEDNDTYFIVYEDGSWQSGGNIPTNLDRLLKRREAKNDLCQVSLGPTGEWFLEAANGKAWCGGLPQSFYELHAPIKDWITAMYFGDEGTGFVRHCQDEGKRKDVRFM